MCGIVGVAGLADEALVRRMAATIAHRGPDGEGYFVGNEISLGARRLSIIDLPGSNQPIFNEDGTVVTVFNGEIYNYRELRVVLEKKGHVLSTAGDTEVLVHLYEEYGEAAVHLLRGMFAYAIWDARQRRLILARDRLGIKPLYYAEVGERLIFASEIKAILASGEVGRDIDVEALNHYLRLEYVPGPRTIVARIQKLPPGHMLVWHDGRAWVRQYWDVVMLEGDRTITEDAAAEEFQATLEQAVRYHRISDVPVGVLLSGGIDSSTVAGLLAREGERLQTFTVGFDVGRKFDELDEARLVANHFHTDHHEVVVTSSIASELPRIVRLQDEPIADPAALPTFVICRFASQSVKVVLTGEGGDEILGGYPRYWWLHMGERLRPWLRGGWGDLGLDRLLRALPLAHWVVQRARTLLSRAALAERHLQWVTTVDERLKAALLGRRLPGGEATDGTGALVRGLLTQAGLEETVPALMYVDFKTWLPDSILMKIDRMSMGVSVEARVPFLDHRLVEFVASLPHRLKVRNFGTKRLLRRTMKSVLPPRTIQRPKRPFRVPLEQWTRGALRGLLIETLTSARARQRGCFDAGTVRSLLDEHFRQHRDHSRVLWSVLCLELWCREVLDASSPVHA